MQFKIVVGLVTVMLRNMDIHRRRESAGEPYTGVITIPPLSAVWVE